MIFLQMIIMVTLSVYPVLKKKYMVIVKNLENTGKAKNKQKAKQKNRKKLTVIYHPGK